MVPLTADDILAKKFPSTKFREGYDIVEVDDFLDEVLSSFRQFYSGNQSLLAENQDLTARLEAAERRIAELTRYGAR